MTDSPISPDGQDPDPKDGRYPSQIKYIVGNEACERFSYYGLVGILELYLSHVMKMGDTEATTTQHLFGTAVYLMPLAGGWLADRWLGRYWTILSISLFYCLGHGTLALYGGTRWGLFTGLSLIAIGAGGIKPCVSAFVGDQFKPSQHHLLTKIYGWFYWAVNLGAAAAFFVVPFLHTETKYTWAFGAPGIAMAVATVIFWLGRKKYINQPPEREVATTEKEAASDRMCLLRIILVFLPVPMFWALFNQTNSTWVLQGTKMIPWHFVNGETMQGSESLLVMIWTPILTLMIYPLCERLGVRPTALRRMTVGMFLGGASFILVGLIQARMDQGQHLSILWQLLPSTVLEAGEVLLSATGLEFAFAQAPRRLKSVVMSLWLMTIAGGHFLIAVFTKLNKATGARQFYFYAELMFVVAVIFAVFAALYRPREGVPA